MEGDVDGDAVDLDGLALVVALVASFAEGNADGDTIGLVG